MVGIYGQVVQAVGYSADYFDSWGDDDPADHEVVVLNGDFTVDPDWLDETLGYLNVSDDEWVRIPGQQCGIRVDHLYAY
jgi:hypothetical protein